MQGNSGRFQSWLLLAAAFFSSSALAQMRERYVVSDRGQNRPFVVAHDELHVANAARVGRTQALAGSGTAEATRLAADKLRRATGEAASIVLYEEGRPRDKFSRRILTEKIGVQLAPGADAAALAAALAAAQGLLNRGPVSPGSRWFIFETTKTGDALDAAETLRAKAGVLAAVPQLARLQHKRFTPNDTYFADQWHLKNTGQSSGLAGTDVNVTSVWDNFKGTGIRIGIVDDGVQTGHPDYVNNIDTVNDHNWNDGTATDPNPNIAAGDQHGNSCAGVAAARGNNGVGVSGAAPEATIVGLRLIGGTTGETDQDDHDAMLWKNDIIAIKSNSWGPADDGKTLEAPGSLLAQAFADAVTTGRGGLGTIITWAAGNGGDVGDNSNYDGYANSIYTIAVAAISNQGTQSFYSEPGANVLITTPSDSNGTTLGIVTTDLTGDDGYNATGTSGNLSNRSYTNDFGGTSSACPLAAGCIALLLQSKPTLGWRDVREILIQSAKKCAATDNDWITNGAGFHFNHKYGAGLLDAQAAVNLAATWTNLGPQQSTSVGPTTSLPAAIPDNSATGLTRTFNVTQSLRVEQVTVTVDITHARRGQLEVTLTSPSGTVSRLAETHFTTTALTGYASWKFMTVRDWGENSTGTWTLKVADRTANNTGTLNSATLTIYGTSGNAPPMVSAANINPTDSVFSDQTLAVSGVNASDAEGDPITISYQWQDSTDGTSFTAIAGATSPSFALTGAQSGRLVRCAVTATSAGQNSAPFFTANVAVDHRPNELARHGVAYSYDSDLFLIGGGGGGTFARAAIINEFSQGPTGSKEWIELLVTQLADLRGFTLADRVGTYVTFTTSSTWSAVPAGTLIVIYNAADKDTAQLPVDQTTPVNGVMVVPNSNTTLFGTNAWGGLSNNNNESIILKNAGSTVVDGIAFNEETTQTPALAPVGGNKAAWFTSDTDAGAESASNWTIGAATAATPGAGNGGANSTLVTALRSGARFRFAVASDLVPGLSIDPITGLVSGTPSVTAGGFFNVVIERYSGALSVALSFPLLVADTLGNYTIPAGKTWTLNSSSTLAADLTVLGTLDTAGRALTVNGTLATTGGTVANSSGLIAFAHRSGPLPPGAVSLISNPTNDVADDDGDGLRNLLELLLGTDPGTMDLPTTTVTRTAAGRLQLLVHLPVGPVAVLPVVEVSTDLATWNSGTGFTTVTGDSTAASVRTLTVESIATAAPLYIRLRASR